MPIFGKTHPQVAPQAPVAPQPVGVRLTLVSGDVREYGPSPEDPTLRCRAHTDSFWLRVMGERAGDRKSVV